MDVLTTLRLALIDKIGPATAKKLISYLGGAEAVLKASKKEVCAIEGIGEIHYRQLHEKDMTQLAEETLLDCQKRNIRIVSYLNAEYPDKLKHCMDSPIILYYQGDTRALKMPRAVSIVGTRSSTRYGEEFTDSLVKKLVSRDVLICSGLAFGIDVAAHKAAVKYKGSTIGIVAHGLQMISPAGHKNVAERMKERGGVLSEHRPGIKVEKGHFPMRNRIVAGISDALIVIESDKRGGSLITAQMANDYNRDVFALPGRFDDQYSRGCNALVQRNQAHILNDIDEFLTMMSWDDEESTNERQIPLFIELDGKEKLIYELLGREPKTMDSISLEANMPTSQVSATLLKLEFQGLVRTLPGKQYVSLTS
jgi:DNA processing protein